MLKQLTVTNLAVVERAEVEFAPSLNVITGETGAGKSVLMGALGLVLGGRADATVVRDGATEAEVEAVFDDHIVRRTITNQGRSRAWIDEESVSVAELKEFGLRRVDIHGARANQQILEEQFQREALDAMGGIAKGREFKAYSAAYGEWRQLKAEVAELEKASGEDELDLLKYQVNEIESVSPTEEDDTLAERHAAAAHAGEIVENANAITEVLGGDRSVEELLITLHPKFAAIARRLPEAESWAHESEEITVRVQELSRTIADAVSRLDLGEESLEALDERLTAVNRLKRKYGATVAEILAKLEEKRAKLDAIEHREERLEEAQAKLAKAETALKGAAKALTAIRRQVAERLGKAVTRELHDLGFLQSKFAVALESAEPEAHGADRVVYMFEPNPGESARPLAAIASSGEIARVMLALKSVLSAHDCVGTLVFDEIDANIGGEVGRIVGEKLRKVAKHHQVIAITHLPQSAACGDRHFVVSKAVSGGRTRTSIAVVEGERRTDEIARMLGGSGVTSVVRKHAAELLKA